jgi:negative regulator of sigma E activity
MSLAEELVILFDLHKSGGISDAEFQALKTRIINENPKEVAKIVTSQKSGSNLSPIQIGAIAGASSLGTRLIMDHYKNDQKLQEQVEKLQTQVVDMENSDSVSHIQVTEIEYQSSNFEPDLDF